MDYPRQAESCFILNILTAVQVVPLLRKLAGLDFGFHEVLRRDR